MDTIQDRMKKRRTALHMTLAEVAELLGVKEATVQRYESGEIKNMKHETVVRLAQIFRCSPAYLMGWSDEILQQEISVEEMHLLDSYRSNLIFRERVIELLHMLKNS